MNTRYTTFALVLLAVMALLATALGSSVSAAPKLPQPSPDTAGDVISSADSPQLLSTMGGRDWTAEEMKNAIPYPLKKAGNGVPMALTDDKSVQPQGQPVYIQGTVPFGARPFESDLAPSLLSVGISGYSYPAPFTRYENFDSYSTYPYKTVGKLFFKQYGTSYVCSAASIGNYAIWTAGHCVHDGSGTYAGWSTDVRFVPGYKNGSAPLGQWKYSSLTTNSTWYNSGDERYDFGGAILKKVGGKKISQKVGSLGFAYNMGVGWSWFDIGYPQAAPFTGGTQQICVSSYAYSDTYFGSPYPTGIGCDQTGGTSGGPWILGFNGSSGGYLNGNNSYRWSGSPYEMYSPYFGDAAYSLYYALFNAIP